MFTAPGGEVGPVACVAFLMRGTGACVLVGGAESFPSDGQDLVSGVFWVACDLSMTLGSLSADRWVCVPVLFVVWCEVSSAGSCRQLGGARSCTQIEVSLRALTD